MLRHLWRAAAGLSLVLIGFLVSPGQSFGQAAAAAAGAGLGGGLLNDPFAFYYGVYLPNQQLQSLRATPMDTINSGMVARQYYAQNERQALV